MLYIVIEWDKLSRCGEDAVFDTRKGAEQYIDNLMLVDGLLDYKTHFTIEKMKDECEH